MTSGRTPFIVYIRALLGTKNLSRVLMFLHFVITLWGGAENNYMGGIEDNSIGGGIEDSYMGEGIEDNSMG